MGDISIGGLSVYPIKSLGGIPLPESRVEKRGLLLDRRWMLVDEEGVFLTQRSDSRLALFKISIADFGLMVTDPRGETVEISFLPSGSKRQVRVWQSDCEAVQVSAHVDAWFSERLGVRCSLVYMPESSLRPTNPDYTRAGDIVGFADAYPVLVVSEEALADLNRRLDIPLPMNRFRPNIVVRGSTPFAEDGWSSLQIGDVKLRAVKKCARCLVTATNQETGEVGVEPLKTLATYRLMDQKVNFGAYFVPETGGCVRVGEVVEIA